MTAPWHGRLRWHGPRRARSNAASISILPSSRPPTSPTEARQSNGEQLAKSEQNYDTTFKVIRDRVSADPEYCTDKKGAEIKADLQRHLKGDFTPNFPKPKVVESCGFFGCAPPPEKFDSKTFWEERDKKGTGRSY